MNRRAPLFAGIGVGVVALLAIVLLVLPKMSQVGDAQDSLEDAENEELTLQAQLQALQDAQAAAPETEREIALLQDQVPPTTELPTLFQQLQSAADRSAVDFFSFSPGSPVADPTARYSTISSQITVNGGYFAVDEFLFLLETLPRAAKVVAISVSPASETTDTTAATPTTPTTTAASPSSLQLQATVEFYTTDSSAGPGSEPGPSETTVGGVGATGGVAATGATGTTGTTGTATGPTTSPGA